MDFFFCSLGSCGSRFGRSVWGGLVWLGWVSKLRPWGVSTSVGAGKFEGGLVKG